MIKRVVIVLLIVLSSFTVFALYRTLAYDTSVVENTPSTTDLDYTFTIGDSSIKQLQVGVNETKYYDVVMYNPNPAKISYVIYYEMVSPTTKPEEFSIVYKKRSRNKSSGIANKESSITLTIEVSNTSSSEVKVNLGSVAGYVKGGELTLASGKVKIPEEVIPPAYKFVKNLTDDGTKENGVYKVHHDEISAANSVTGNIIPAVDDYRYYGANPDNYICLKLNSDNTCPDKYLYRIIGSIYDELEGTNKLKVIKATTLKAGDGSTGTVTKFAWNQTTATNNASYRQNIWAPVTDSTTGYSNAKELPSTGRDNSGSTLMEMLNSEGDNGLWWGGKSGTMYYTDSGMQTKTVDFSGDEYKMESDVLDMISTTRYYLAGHGTSEITSDTMYAYERTKTGYNNGRYSDVRPYYWDGKVAVMYPSDYGYAAGETCATGTNLYNYSTSGCKNTDWLWYTSDYQWVLSPSSSFIGVAFVVSSAGGVGYNNVNPVNYGRSVYPVFNLTSDVIIVGGSGTSSSPYQITKG